MDYPGAEYQREEDLLKKVLAAKGRYAAGQCGIEEYLLCLDSFTELILRGKTSHLEDKASSVSAS